jgi:hypothetical protein
MLLCNFCKNSLLGSGNQWDYHQKSYHHLEEAAAKLCVFCSSLYEDVNTFCNKASISSGVELEWPLYRWSMRKLGHIRERMEEIVLAFRPLPQVMKRNDKDQRKVGRGVLPERMFYLFSENGNLLHVFASKPTLKYALTDTDDC